MGLLVASVVANAQCDQYAPGIFLKIAAAKSQLVQIALPVAPQPGGVFQIYRTFGTNINSVVPACSPINATPIAGSSIVYNDTAVINLTNYLYMVQFVSGGGVVWQSNVITAMPHAPIR